MSKDTWALLSTLGTGTVLWALGAWAQRQGWIFNRQTEDHKLDRQRLSELEEQRAERDELIRKQEELIQALRIEIIDMKVKGIGGPEISEKQRQLLVATPEEMYNLVRRENDHTP